MNGSPSPTGLTSAEAATAATELDAILETMAELTPALAQGVTSYISSLLGAQGLGTGSVAGGGGAIGGGSDEGFDPQTSARLQSSLAKLTTAATPGGEPLQLSSPNLNLTTQAFSATALSGQGGEPPALRVSSTNGQEATVAMPSSVLEGLSGLDPSVPISALLYVTASSLHPTSRLRVGGRRRLASTSTIHGGSNGSTSGNGSGISAGAAVTSPMLSFSLLQLGVELSVSGAREAINVSIPTLVPAGEELGNKHSMGGASGLNAASSTLVCHWWDDSDGGWSTEGCVTLPGELAGEVICSCDHLTDVRAHMLISLHSVHSLAVNPSLASLLCASPFISLHPLPLQFIIFEMPTDFAQLVDAFLVAFTFNTLGSNAWQCAASDAYRHSAPLAMIVAVASIASLTLLCFIQAARRDQKDIQRLLAMRRRVSVSSSTSSVTPSVPSLWEHNTGDPSSHGEYTTTFSISSFSSFQSSVSSASFNQPQSDRPHLATPPPSPPQLLPPPRLTERAAPQQPLQRSRSLVPNALERSATFGSLIAESRRVQRSISDLPVQLRRSMSFKGTVTDGGVLSWGQKRLRGVGRMVMFQRSALTAVMSGSGVKHAKKPKRRQVPLMLPKAFTWGKVAKAGCSHNTSRIPRSRSGYGSHSSHGTR